MYCFKDNKRYHQLGEIIVVEPSEWSGDKFCIDDKSIALLNLLTLQNAVLQDNTLKIGKSKIKLIDGDIELPKSDLIATVHLPVDKLKRAAKFIASADSQPILNGVYINSLGTIAATDRYKLYLSGSEYDANGITLPVEFIKALTGDYVDISYNLTRAVAVCGDTTIYTRLYSGKYPDITPLVNLANYKEFDFAPIFTALPVGLQVGGEISLYVKDNELRFLGDNEYVLDYAEDVAFGVIASQLQLIESNYKAHYKDSKSPLIFTTNKDEIILIVPIRIN